jgi:hypothetical protein
VEAHLPLFDGVSLKFTTNPSTGKEFATGRLQKGWLLCQAGAELSEESVGFGVPVLQRGLTTIFPGEAELDIRRDGRGMDAVFMLNLEERIGGSGARIIRTGVFLDWKKRLAYLYRTVPGLRSGLTTLSSLLRKVFRMQTAYEPTPDPTIVRMRYRLIEPAGRLRVEADFSTAARTSITEAIIMNEQGGRTFDRYFDSDGNRAAGDRIGGWDPVTADSAAFHSPRYGLAFTLRRLSGSRLFRGRELVDQRLAWSGFGYVLPPAAGRFEYDLQIGKQP